MRRVERRESAPQRLLDRGEIEREKAVRRFGPPADPSVKLKFSAYKEKEVKHALERLFHGKCAYCETYYASAQPMDVEHYRPKGALFENKSHTGYWWQAMVWENLLPSCIDCNRKRNQPTIKADGSAHDGTDIQLGASQLDLFSSGKKDRFPLAENGARAMGPDDALSNEKPLLLNPCNDDPAQHLTFFFDPENPVSFVTPRKLEDGEADDFQGENGLSTKGRASIDIYGFNRIGLVQARTEILRRLVFLESVIIDLAALAERMSAQKSEHVLLAQSSETLLRLMDRVVEELAHMAKPEAPFSAMVSAWLVGFQSRFAV